MHDSIIKTADKATKINDEPTRRSVSIAQQNASNTTRLEDEQELPSGKSLWDKLPRELRDIVFKHVDPFTLLLNNRLDSVDKLGRETARAVLHGALESGWLGDYKLLPSVTGREWLFWPENKDLIFVKSRKLYEHLCKFFPEFSEANPVFANIDTGINKSLRYSERYNIHYETENQNNKGPRLINIAMHNMWLDLIGDWIQERPYAAAFCCVQFGHVDLLLHLIDNNLIRYQYLVWWDYVRRTYHMMNIAAINRHLDVLKLLHELKCTSILSFAIENAAEGGHLDVVKFLHENRSDGCSELAIDHAAKNGRLEAIKFLLESRPEGFTQKSN